MQVQFNSDNRVPGGAFAIEVEEMVRSRLDRLSDRLTRVEVHVGDVNGSKGGADDKRCMIELRPTGMQPISATEHAPTVEAAVASATNKAMSAFDRRVGKVTTRKGH